MIGLIAFNELHVSQYIYKYTSVLDSYDIPYKVLYWSRAGLKPVDRGFKGEALCYGKPLDTYKAHFLKASAMMGYRRFLIEAIRAQKFDKLIVFTSQAAIVLADLLCGEYRGRCIFDYRDITYEFKLPGYKRKLLEVMGASSCTMFASPGFIEFLALGEDRFKGKVCLAHNSQNAWTSFALPGKRKGAPIRLNYWGIVRQVSFIKSLCDVFGSDERFDLTFYGEGRIEDLVAHCRERGYSNVRFAGRYNYREDIEGMVATTDIVNCLYENDRATCPTLAVKLYDALNYKLPILVSKESYLAKYLHGMTFGHAVSLADANLPDCVYSWYSSLDELSMSSDFDEFRRRIESDDERFCARLLDFSKG